MPRVSAAQAAMASFLVEERVRPPGGLPTAERAVFLDIVASVKPAHFHTEDLHLLSAYSTVVAFERHLAGRIARARAKGEAGAAEADRLGALHGQAANSLMRLSHVLRIGPLARSPVNHRRAPSDAISNGAKPHAWTEDDLGPDAPNPRPWKQ